MAATDAATDAQAQVAATKGPLILLTRPQALSHAFAQALETRLHAPKIVIAPLLKTEVTAPVPAPTPGRVLVITSQTAVLVDPEGLRAWQGHQVFCVGATTAQTLSAAGLHPNFVAETAQTLLRHLLDNSYDDILHIGGTDISLDIAQKLRDQGRHAHHVAIYRQEPQDLSPQVARQLNLHAVIAPVFSANSARQLAAALAPLNIDQLTCLALSPKIASVLRASLDHAEVIETPSPTRQSMIDQLVLLE